MLECNTIVIIPCKMDSKRLPNKNLSLIGDKTLLEYAILYAQQSEYTRQIIVSTESDEVRDIWLLIHMSGPAEVVLDLPSFKKLQKNSKLTTSQIKQWGKINSSSYVSKLWNWKLSITADNAKAEGWLGAGIGKYIRQKEEELFISS